MFCNPFYFNAYDTEREPKSDYKGRCTPIICCLDFRFHSTLPFTIFIGSKTLLSGTVNTGINNEKDIFEVTHILLEQLKVND